MSIPATFPVFTVLSTERSAYADLKEQLNTINKEAELLTNLEEKRVQYDKAFQTIRTYILHQQNPRSEIYIDLAQFFEVYAAKTCYAQGSKEKDEKGISKDNEEGFRKSARLMEYSFRMQLLALGLEVSQFDLPDDLKKYEHIEDLIESLETQPEREGKFFPFVQQCNVNADVLVKKGEDQVDQGFRNVLTKTLIRMTFSHQNIASLKQSPSLHKTYQHLTEKLIGSEHSEAKLMFADYLYNRCCFLVNLVNPDDWKSKIKSYEPVEKLLRSAYAEKDPALLSYIAKIENMKGLIITRSQESKETAELAEAHFKKSYELREQLLKAYTEEDKKFDQQFLMANLRTGLINCLSYRIPLEQKDLNPEQEQALVQAQGHREALASFLQDLTRRGNQNAYIDSYTRAIEKVDGLSKQRASLKSKAFQGRTN